MVMKKGKINVAKSFVKASRKVNRAARSGSRLVIKKPKGSSKMRTKKFKSFSKKGVGSKLTRRVLKSVTKKK